MKNLNRCILILTLFLFHFDVSVAKTLHVFLFGNTKDDQLKKIAPYNVQSIGDWSQLVAKALNFHYNPHPLSGVNFTLQQFNEEIDQSTFQPDDIVILYVNTHGDVSLGADNHFPNIYVPDNRNKIQIYSIYKKLQSKHPRSVYTIIEACSGYTKANKQAEFIHEIRKQSSSEIDNSDLTQIQIDNINVLFQTTCDLIITAGEPGKDTYGLDDDGSFFTNSFLKAFNEITNAKKNSAIIDWGNLLKKTRDYTYQMQMGIIPEKDRYHPIWERKKCLFLTRQGANDSLINIIGDTSITLLDTLTPKIANKLIIYPDPNPVKKGFPLFRKTYYVINLSISPSNDIDSVKYFLDRTMPEPIINRTNFSENFHYSFRVYGTYPIKAKVYYKNGVIDDFYGEIVLPKEESEN